MTDRLGNKLKKGDIVLYWHKRTGWTRPDLGEVINVPNTIAKNIVEIKYTTEDGHEETCFRSKSGLTRFTKEQALLWKLEGITYNDQW